MPRLSVTNGLDQGPVVLECRRGSPSGTTAIIIFKPQFFICPTTTQLREAIVESSRAAL
jgi:hypothetical protein